MVEIAGKITFQLDWMRGWIRMSDMDEQSYEMLRFMAGQLVELNKTARFFKNIVIFLIVAQVIGVAMFVMMGAAMR